MSRYIDRLKEHPGVPMASMMTGLFFFAAFANAKVSINQSLVIGAVASLLVWSVVLLTAIPDHDKQSGGQE